MPHVKRWYTSEGQEMTWERLADRVMRQRLAQGVCFGNHRLHALALLLRVDETHALLSPEARQRVVAHLQDATRRLVKNQHQDGYWEGNWPGDEADGPQPARLHIADGSVGGSDLGHRACVGMVGFRPAGSAAAFGDPRPGRAVAGQND